MKQVPEVRLVIDPDGVMPPYAIIRHPKGYWYGIPGDFKRKLTDEDIVTSLPDAIPLQPGPSAIVEVRYSADGEFDDNSLCDVDVNGKPGARRVSAFIAGAFIVTAAIQKDGEPVMVRAARKKGGPVALTPSKSGLSLVRDGQPGG